MRFEDLPKVNSERWFSLEDLPEEVWKNVPGYEGILQVSNYSRVLNMLTGEIMRQSKDGMGYLRIVLRMNNVYKHIAVHRLVLLAFVSNPEGKRCADHIDTNKLNNTLGNLRWTTHKENANNIITKRHRKESHAHTIFSDKRVAKLDREGNLLCTYNSVTEAALDTGLKKCSISNAAHGRLMPNKYGQIFQCKTAGGYKWQYI